MAAGCSSSTVDRSPQPLPSPRIEDSVTQLGEDPWTGRAVPASAPVGQGVLYAFDFRSHCGILAWDAWDVDGSFWDVAADTPEPSRDEMSDPVDHGTIELTGPDQAVYTTSGGVAIGLERSKNREREGLLCV